MKRNAATGFWPVRTPQEKYGPGREATRRDVEKDCCRTLRYERGHAESCTGEAVQPCPIPTPPGWEPCRLPRGHAGLHDFPRGQS